MSFRLGKIWGFPIEIDVSWFLVFALVVWSLSVGYFGHLFPDSPASLNWLVALITALFFFGSVLLHELAHSYVAVKNGLEIGGITLFIFGGVSKLTQEPRTPQLELKMSLAGPLTSLALGVIFWGIYRGALALSWPAQFVATVFYLALINVLLAVFNLVPGFPLDGGRVLRALIWRTTGNLEKASRYASYAGQGFGYLLILGGFLELFSGITIGGLWLVFIGWFLVGAAQNAYQQVVMKRALSGVPVEQIMQHDVPRVPPETSLRDLVDKYFMRYDYSAYPVVEGENLLGVVTVDDVRTIPQEAWTSTTAAQAASQPNEHGVIDEKEDAWEALSQMATDDTRRLLVVHEGHLEGVVSRENILHLVRVKMQFEA